MKSLKAAAKKQGCGLATLLFGDIEAAPFLTEQELAPILSLVEQSRELPDSALTVLPTIDASLKALGVKLPGRAPQGIQNLRVSIFIARSLCVSRKSCGPAVKLISKISGYEADVESEEDDKKMARLQVLYDIAADHIELATWMASCMATWMAVELATSQLIMSHGQSLRA